MRSRHLPRNLALLLLAAGAAACEQATLPEPPPILAPAPEVQAFLPSIADANERIVPGLSDTKVAVKIGEELSVLDHLLAQRDASRIRDSLRILRRLIAEYAPNARVADGAELSAIELVIDAMESLLSEARQ